MTTLDNQKLLTGINEIKSAEARGAVTSDQADFLVSYMAVKKITPYIEKMIFRYILRPLEKELVNKNGR